MRINHKENAFASRLRNFIVEFFALRWQFGKKVLPVLAV